MKILQSILSKSLLIALAILAGIGYHFRADLFPKWFPASAPADQPAQTPQPRQETPVATLPAPPPVMAVPSPVTEMPAAPAPAPAPVTSLPEPYEPGLPSMAEPEVTPEPAPVAPEAVEPQSNTDAERTAAPAMQNAISLDAARAAFWAKDISQAEQLYHQLAKEDPSAAEPLGELGNLYYMQGRWNEAAEAYAGAVMRLAKSGDIPHARHMLMILDGLDPARAQYIWQSGAVGGG